ncbi:MAG: response regulator [Beijerinckiaceae bacterium]|nr:response regulator [Beijerinckiaceae bacterium]MCI0736486.1 response regulator [Beijerinckiaceae bacterium]
MEARPPDPCNIVLVVEDEPFVRLMAADVLSLAGFSVLEAGNADEALRILEAQAEVRVVFTDVDMPGSIDGLGLAERIGQRWPRIGIVFASGHRHYIKRISRDSRFLAKPYAGKALVREIEESMYAAAPASSYSNSLIAYR